MTTNRGRLFIAINIQVVIADVGSRWLRRIALAASDRAGCRGERSLVFGHQSTICRNHVAALARRAAQMRLLADKDSPPVEPVPDDVVDATLKFLPEVVADVSAGGRGRRGHGRHGADSTLNWGSSGRDLHRAAVRHRPRRSNLDLPAVQAQDTTSWPPALHPYRPPRARDPLPYLLRSPKAFCFSPRDSENQRRAEQHANRKTPIDYGNRPGTNRKAKPQRQPREQYDQNSYRTAVYKIIRPVREQVRSASNWPDKSVLQESTSSGLTQRYRLRQNAG